MDAVRIEDGRQVMLKKVLPEEGPHELLITQTILFTGLKGTRRTTLLILSTCRKPVLMAGN
jgi:hypothetical protein